MRGRRRSLSGNFTRHVTATQKAFEFTIGVAVPEPGTVALLGLGFAMRRRPAA